jgi:uncharacterized protein (DUF697 family)
MKKKLPKAISRPSDPIPDAVIQVAPEPENDPRRQVQAEISEVQPAPRAPEETTTTPLSATLSEANRHDALMLVERFAFWAAAAGAIPLPGLDLAGIGAVQVQMVRRLAEMFGVEFSRSRGKAVVAAVGGALITGSSGIGAASLTKTIPIVGTAVSTIAVPTLAAGATYAIGIAFIEHFASGGTLLNFDLQKARAALRKAA